MDLLLDSVPRQRVSCGVQGLRATAEAAGKKAIADREAWARDTAWQEAHDARLAQQTEAEDAEMQASLAGLAGCPADSQPYTGVRASSSSSSTPFSMSPSLTSSSQSTALMPMSWFVADCVRILGGHSALAAASWSDAVLDRLLCCISQLPGRHVAEGKHPADGTQGSGCCSAVLGAALMLDVHHMPTSGQSKLIDHLSGYRSALGLAGLITSSLAEGSERNELAEILAPLMYALAKVPASQSVGAHQGSMEANRQDHDSRMRPLCRQLALLFGSNISALARLLKAYNLEATFCTLSWNRSNGGFNNQLKVLKEHLEMQQDVRMHRPNLLAATRQPEARQVGAQPSATLAHGRHQQAPSSQQKRLHNHNACGRTAAAEAQLSPCEPVLGGAADQAHQKPAGKDSQVGEGDADHFRGWEVVCGYDSSRNYGNKAIAWSPRHAVSQQVSLATSSASLDHVCHTSVCPKLKSPCL